LVGCRLPQRRGSELFAEVIMSRNRIAICLLASTIALGAGAPAIWAQHEEHDHAPPSGAPPEELGEVSFPVSCNAAAQAEFDRAMALFHSFWFVPARESFARVLEHDPTCGMAHWGLSIVSMGNPFGWPPNPRALEAGAAAYAEAVRVGARTERERAYIAALGAFFAGWQSTDHRPRALAFKDAMRDVAASFADDVEAQILYALLLTATALPTDKTFAHQLEAGRILEPLFAKVPDHPGVAHQLIHAYDYADLAERGLPAARAYAKIAPSVPHALHMPSHIFSRIGSWQEMVAANEDSYAAAKSELQEATLGVGSYDALHAMDYLVLAHLQQAQDKAAKRYVDETAAISKIEVQNFVAAYAFAAIPARYALERGDFAGAAGLELSPPTLAWQSFPQAEAILVFARALGRARTGDPEGARADVARLRALREAMLAAKLDYWAGQTAFQIEAVDAWVALAEGRPDDALRLARAAAEAEEKSDKHPVTPGNVAPSRELLADLLLERGDAAGAQAEYERSLRRDPNRYRAIAGAARAARAAGDTDQAERHSARLLELTAQHDTERPELALAKQLTSGAGRRL
jgi:tetratricopeptide (TPR) repeat protein